MSDLTFDFTSSNIPNLQVAYAGRKTVTARWKLPDLITALSTAGWGPLSGYEWQGLRSVLRALCDRVNHITGEGFTTAYQIADSAGLSERWTRTCLSRMEELGLLEWKRGGIVRGERQPSFFRVVKKALAQLVRDARAGRAGRYKKRTADFIKRLNLLKKTTVFSRKVRKLPELSASPSPLRVDDYQSSSTQGVKSLPHSIRPEHVMIDIPIPRPSKWTDYCKHFNSYDKSIIVTCPDCRLASMSTDELAEYDGLLRKAEREEERKHQPISSPTAEDLALEKFMSFYYPGLSGAQRALAYAKDLRKGSVPSFNQWYAQKK